MATQSRTHQLGPAIMCEISGEEFSLTAEFLALSVHVVHELVNQSERYLLDLAFWVGHFAHKDISGSVDSTFCVGVEHAISFRRQTHLMRRSL